MSMSPREIVNELDRYIVGQDEAKKAVAIALRNRYRRSRLTEEEREEITPKNIIMQGPTGVGKTEIARRLAKLVKAPFIKVEATKFTEVGYVGRDVESMVRDLVECSIRLVKDEKRAELAEQAKKNAANKIIDAITSTRSKKNPDMAKDVIRAQVESDYAAGKLDSHLVLIEVEETPRPVEQVPGAMEINVNELLGGILPKKKKKRTLAVSDAVKILADEEMDKQIDMDNVYMEAIRRAEQNGIIFIDEIDKIAAKGSYGGPDVSREGVQRDILPIVEGCTVMTKYGAIKTDFILFIASGAFQISSVHDLIPELQGRFPINVTLKSLSYEDFIRILTVPENSITKQYKQLLAVDNIDLSFTDDAIAAISQYAVMENQQGEDIGARRLHTIMESLLEDLSFNADGTHPMTTVVVDKQYVDEHLSSQAKQYDLKKYII